MIAERTCSECPRTFPAHGNALTCCGACSKHRRRRMADLRAARQHEAARPVFMKKWGETASWRKAAQQAGIPRFVGRRFAHEAETRASA